MYCQISISVQLDNGKTLTLSPWSILVLNKFQSSGFWFFGSQRCFLSLNEKILSFARDFSSSLLAPPNAASNLYLSNACINDCVFITSVWIFEPLEIGFILFRTPSWLIWTNKSKLYFLAISSLKFIISLNFHVVSICINLKGILLG